MSLLELQHLAKRYRRGSSEHEVLRDVCLELDGGELLAIWGPRHSGRSTLLRLASGLQTPTSGIVRFTGKDLATSRAGAIASGIGYCQPTHDTTDGRTVLEELSAPSLARGASPAKARALAQSALEHTGAQHCTQLTTRELDSAESVRVRIAQALSTEPLLLLIDEPTKGVDLLERDRILRLLRTLADDGIAILACVGESTCLSGADRALALHDGELHGESTPQLAPILELPQPAIG